MPYFFKGVLKIIRDTRSKITDNTHTHTHTNTHTHIYIYIHQQMHYDLIQ